MFILSKVLGKCINIDEYTQVLFVDLKEKEIILGVSFLRTIYVHRKGVYFSNTMVRYKRKKIKVSDQMYIVKWRMTNEN